MLSIKKEKRKEFLEKAENFGLKISKEKDCAAVFNVMNVEFGGVLDFDDSLSIEKNHWEVSFVSHNIWCCELPNPLLQLIELGFIENI